MTARVLVKGTLIHAPESQTLKNGGLCVMVTLIAKDGDYTRFWHIRAFDEAVQAALLGLSDGDAVAVQGSLKAEFHDRNGEPALSFGVIAERAHGLHQLGKKRTKEER